MIHIGPWYMQSVQYMYHLTPGYLVYICRFWFMRNLRNKSWFSTKETWLFIIYLYFYQHQNGCINGQIYLEIHVVIIVDIPGSMSWRIPKQTSSRWNMSRRWPSWKTSGCCQATDWPTTVAPTAAVLRLPTQGPAPTAVTQWGHSHICLSKINETPQYDECTDWRSSCTLESDWEENFSLLTLTTCALELQYWVLLGSLVIPSHLIRKRNMKKAEIKIGDIYCYAS